MGTIHCACGQSFSDGEIPCKFENHLIPDTSVEHLTRLVIDAVTAGTDLDLEVGYLITSHGATTYECPYCRRLIVFWDGIDKPARSYSPDILVGLSGERQSVVNAVDLEK